MKPARHALLGARIFDGERMHDNAALVLDGAKIEAIIPADALDAALPRTVVGPGLLAPGFVDLQVNGGGDVMLNDMPSADAMARIARAHRSFGTTALLPTLITDRPAVTAAAIAAAIEAVGKAPGVIGLHLEGPHLAPARRGAHDAALMRPLTEADADTLIEAAGRIGLLLVTVAVEAAPPAIIRRLVDGGVRVSIGHSDARFEDVQAAADAGASLVTHLFNAMSPLENRAPGVVGAALDDGRLSAGIIADGHHVHPATLRIALRAKRGPGRLFLVTDAMSTVGGTRDHFELNGRRVNRADGRLTLADGTLAGSDLDMAAAVRFAHAALECPLGEALAMASRYPAEAAGIADRFGRLVPGRQADIVLLDPDGMVAGTWIAGKAG